MDRYLETPQPARTSPHPLGGRLLKSAAAGWSLLRSQDLILACALLEQHPLSQSGCFTVSLGNQQSVIISRDSPGEAGLRAANGLQWRGTNVVVIVVGSGQRRNPPH